VKNEGHIDFVKELLQIRKSASPHSASFDEFMLSCQYRVLTNRRLKIEQGLGDGVFATDFQGNPIAPDLHSKLTEGILHVLNYASRLEVVNTRRDALVDYFTCMKLSDQSGVLKLSQKEEITCMKYRDSINFTIKHVSVDFECPKIVKIRFSLSSLVQRFPAGLDQWRAANLTKTVKFKRHGQEWAVLGHPRLRSRRFRNWILDQERATKPS
jgi:hypothetical protein